MRIPVGQIVNADADVNLSDLKPLDKIIAAVINAYHNTSMYRRRVAETEEKRQEQERRDREVLIESIIGVINQEIEKNSMLSSKGDTCKAILLEIPARAKARLPEILDVHEFDAYNLTIIPPVPILAKNANPPTLLLVVSKDS